jgi:muramoyltetrapeptide carboxypeptidase
MSLRKPKALQRGDTIGVVAPASGAESQRVEKGMARLQSSGFEPRLFPYQEGPRHYLAGSDVQRAQAFMSAYLDPTVDAVWCLRGGFGCARILDHLDFTALLAIAKPVIGFSDVTALLLTLTARLKQVTFHAPVVTQMGDLPAQICEQVTATLSGAARRVKLTAQKKIYRGGKAQGTLMGGNLATLCSLIGTPYCPDLNGAILFLEDVGEPPYRLDRMMNQLHQSGLLKGIKGLVLGDFGLSTERDRNAAQNLWQEVASRIEGPVIEGLPCGHFGSNLCIPIGVRAELDSQADHLRFLEAVVE